MSSEVAGRPPAVSPAPARPRGRGRRARLLDAADTPLARVGNGGGAASAEKITAAVSAEVRSQLAKLGKRLDAIEAAQATLRAELGKVAPSPSGPTAEDQRTLAKATGKLTTRVSIIERDLRTLNKGVVELVDEVERK